MTRRHFIAALVAALIGSTAAQAQILYGLSNGFGTATDNEIYQIDPATGTISNAVQITVAGETLNNSLALVAQPGTGTLFAVLQTASDGGQNRRLATIDPATGVATTIGNLGNAFSSLAFRANGVLYGVTGDGANVNPSTLFTIDTATAVPTLQFALGNGADGEVIGFHPNGLLYHSSGNTTALFESIDVDTQTVTPIGSSTPEMFAIGYHPGLGQLLGSDLNSALFSIDIATGARTPIGTINGLNDNRGLAFVPVPEPTSLALVGLGGAALALRVRKRRAAAV